MLSGMLKNRFIRLEQQRIPRASGVVMLLMLSQLLFTPAIVSAQTGSADDSFHSPGGAFLRSLVFPGWGENYIGRPTSGNWFRGIEFALLAGVTGFSVYSSWRAEEYRSYAEVHAGIDSDGRSHAYFVNMGIYNDVDSYNQAMRRNNNFDACLYDAADAWQWDSRDNRLHFRNIRLAADDARAKATILGGGIFLNHVFSAIHALKLANTDGIELTLNPADSRQLVTISYTLP
jgi:hypothetical protein